MSKGLHNGDSPVQGELTLSKALGLAERRFWGTVQQRGLGDCWLWQGNRSGGKDKRQYGQFSVAHPDGTPRKRLSVYAHRAAWILTHGEIPPGMQVCHRCDVRLCSNPAHLFLGTHTDNMRDASAKGRLSVSRKRNRNIRPMAVARYLAGGIAAETLGAEYGVHQLTILRWVHAEVGAADLRRRAS